jgi:hypothetical protein
MYKPGVVEPQMRSRRPRAQLDGHDGFRAPGARGGHPGELNEPMRFEPEKAPVVRMTLASKVSLKKKQAFTSAFINTVPRAANQVSNPRVQAS